MVLWLIIVLSIVVALYIYRRCGYTIRFKRKGFGIGRSKGVIVYSVVLQADSYRLPRIVIYHTRGSSIISIYGSLALRKLVLHIVGVWDVPYIMYQISDICSIGGITGVKTIKKGIIL